MSASAELEALTKFAQALGYPGPMAAMSSMAAVIRQASNDTFGHEMLPKEFAEASSYDS